MDFLRAGLPHELDETCAGGSTYDRVIDQDDTLALDFRADRVQLDLDEILTLRLSWCDEGSSDVLVLANCFLKAIAATTKQSALL